MYHLLIVSCIDLGSRVGGKEEQETARLILETQVPRGIRHRAPERGARLSRAGVLTRGDVEAAAPLCHAGVLVTADGRAAV